MSLLLLIPETINKPNVTFPIFGRYRNLTNQLHNIIVIWNDHSENQSKLIRIDIVVCLLIFMSTLCKGYLKNVTIEFSNWNRPDLSNRNFLRLLYRIFDTASRKAWWRVWLLQLAWDCNTNVLIIVSCTHGETSQNLLI